LSIDRESWNLRSQTEETVVAAVLIVEDNVIMREILVARFRAGGQFDSVIEAATGAEALIAAAQQQLTAVVLDLSLPDARGTSLIPTLRVHSPRARIVVFSADVAGRIEAERSGADGFVLKGADLTELDRMLTEGSDW
jgi:DNA-binding NarL/FixJ family response regulator